MKEIHFIFWILIYCYLEFCSSLHQKKFEKIKAEDLESNFKLKELNLNSNCDLTSNYCDLNCCGDQDCSEDEKMGFICHDAIKEEPPKFTSMNCDQFGQTDFQTGGPLLCLHDKNTPYLGDFYTEFENISDNNLLDIGSSKRKASFKFKINNLISNNSDEYKYGSNIAFHDNKGKSHTINIYSNILSKGNGYCSKAPIKYLINESSHCLFLMNEEECLSNKELHLQYHINTLNNLVYLGKINNVYTKYKILCLRNSNNNILYNGDSFNNQREIFSSFQSIECENNFSTQVIKSDSVCENVVVGLNYNISFNHTKLMSVDVAVYVANVSYGNNKVFLFNKDSKHFSKNKLNDKILYIFQKISVTFYDFSNISKTNNKGYFTGQLLFQ